MSTADFLQQWSDEGAYPYVHGVCVGKWPSGGQSFYSNGCIGHDEPALNPFSNLPGSGGNVSWNVSLPVDGGPTHNQSDVYIAIWFGMNLYDPYGYDGQCFLELQLYPDTNGAGAIQVGVWSGFAVAWQIQLSNGFEDPCFAAPLNEPNGTPFQMNAGDHLFVNMTGWQGSPLGERISVADMTLGVTSHLRLFNHRLNYPLNPAYLANNLDDSLPWSPGGDLPVAFAFESGHTIDDPENDTFGGCNTGAPPPTPFNGAVPCGSYNPKDWAQDTKVPWHFYPVTFFNAHARQVAAQYGFEQDFGAAAWIDGLSAGTCTGLDGSAYCSYPWYSYDASLNAFEFGATDYTGTTNDFGTYSQYSPSLQTNSGGLNYYPVQNHTVGANPGDSLSLGVQGAGTVYFLSNILSHSTSIAHLPSGAYSLNAVPAPGEYFLGYHSSGAVQLDAAGTAWNSFVLSGNAQIKAEFSPAPPVTPSVTFQDTGGPGFVTFVPGFSLRLDALYPPAGPGYGLGPVFHSAATNVYNGGNRPLAPGIYSIQANPRPGYNFTGWSASPGIYVFTPAANFTWMNVTSSGGMLTAHFAATPLKSTVWLAAYPSQGGQIEFGSSTHGSGAVFKVPQGTYPIRAIPSPGYQFVTWASGFVSTMSNFSESSNVLVQYGDDYITAIFHTTAVLTSGTKASEGGFAVNGVAVHGSVALSQVGNVTYQLAAVPEPGYAFSHWSVGTASQAWVAAPNFAITSLQVNGSTTLTPHFVSSLRTAPVGFVAHGGSILFNAVDAFRGVTSLVVTKGTYYLGETPNAGHSFAGWSTSGKVAVATTYTINMSSPSDVQNLQGTWTPWYQLTVSGPGTVSARFAGTVHPVTFIDFPFNSHLTLRIAGHGTTLLVPAGTTAYLASGAYTVTLLGGSVPGLAWFANLNLTLVPGHGRSATLTVDGSGSIYVVGEPVKAVPHGAGPAGPSAAPFATARPT